MGMFTKISSEAFQNFQLNAGMLLNTFNPQSPAAPADSAIIAATTGGIKPELKPTFIDLGEDVDNCPENMMELKNLQYWTATLGATLLDITPEAIQLALGAADISGNKITPRNSLQLTDFKDIWWVGDRTDGGWAAIRLINALSTDGFSLQTTKNGKGQTTITLTGHYTLNNQDQVPMEFYSADGN